MLLMLMVVQVSLCERSRTELQSLVDQLKAAVTGELTLLLDLIQVLL